MFSARTYVLGYTSESANTISTVVGEFPPRAENTYHFRSTFTSMEEESLPGSIIAKGSTFLGIATQTLDEEAISALHNFRGF